MVYGGKPSTGCYLCRRRKIKCDEMRPTCRNCAVHGTPCPGYREVFVFQNETNKVKQLVEKGRRSESTSPRQTKGLHDAPVRYVPAYLADSTWEERALCYFFEQYTISSDTSDKRRHMEFLPGFYALCRDNANPDCSSSSLRWAVDAAALSSLANEVKMPLLTVKARESHGNALRAVNQALSSPNDAVRDETFAAIVLLALFEDINGERKGLLSSHTAGFQLLMKLRGEHQLSRERGRSLFGSAYRHIQTEILGLRDRPTIDLSWMIGMFDGSDPLDGMMCTITKISQLLLRTPQTLSLEGNLHIPSGAEILSWIEAARLLDVELSQWHQNVSENWLPRVVKSEGGDSLLTYQDVSIAGIWNFYRAARIILQGAVLDMLQNPLCHSAYGRDSLGDFITGSVISIPPEDIIKDMISDTCRGIPFSLGDVDPLGNPISVPKPSSGLESRQRPFRAVEGYELLWPLWHITLCALATPEQINQARTALRRLGSAFGIKLASILASDSDLVCQLPSLM